MERSEMSSLPAREGPQTWPQQCVAAASINRVFSSRFNRPLVSTRRPIGSSLITNSLPSIPKPRACQTVGTLMVSDSRNCRIRWVEKSMISGDLLHWLHALLLVWSGRRTRELQECGRRAKPTMLLGRSRKVEGEPLVQLLRFRRARRRKSQSGNKRPSS